MNNGWTPQRKANHALAIQQWKPWQRATGPKTPEGKSIVSRNAFKGGKRPGLRSLMRELKQELEGQRKFLGSFRKPYL